MVIKLSLSEDFRKLLAHSRRRGAGAATSVTLSGCISDDRSPKEGEYIDVLGSFSSLGHWITETSQDTQKRMTVANLPSGVREAGNGELPQELGDVGERKFIRLRRFEDFYDLTRGREVHEVTVRKLEIKDTGELAEGR